MAISIQISVMWGPWTSKRSCNTTESIKKPEHVRRDIRSDGNGQAGR